MDALERSTLVLQAVVPAGLLAWMAWGPRRRPLSWALDLALVAAWLAAVGLAGLWLALPRGLLWIWLALLVPAAWAGWPGRRAGAPAEVRMDRWPGILLRVGVLLPVTGALAVALSGRRPLPGPAVELAFPLRDGVYLVANGGSRTLVNAHLVTLSGERYRDYRGQSYAVDLVKVGTWGSRRSASGAAGPEDWAIFGDPVHAPCGGRVVGASDGAPDLRLPGDEAGGLAGNHVILDCGGAWIVLAHLQRGSVAVAPGDTVEVSDVLGRVGNSGHSDEPHLHVHAQSPGTAAAPLGGAPLPMTFDGRHLVRNDRARGG